MAILFIYYSFKHLKKYIALFLKNTYGKNICSPIMITDYYFVNNLFGTVYFIKLVEFIVQCSF